MHEIGQELVKEKKEAALSTINGEGYRKMGDASQVAGRDLLSTLGKSACLSGVGTKDELILFWDASAIEYVGRHSSPAADVGRRSSSSCVTIWPGIVLKCNLTVHFTEISTFFVAGRATTSYVHTSSHRSSDKNPPSNVFSHDPPGSSAMSWATYALCCKPEFQRLLRDEVCAVTTDMPTFDDLNGLPFLDAVVRETLRLYSPVPGTPRIAKEDTVLPLSEPYVDVNGVKRDSIL